MDIEKILVDMGMEVVGPATSLKSALELAEAEEIDGAMLDVDLGDGDLFTPVVNTLIARGIPFALATGFSYWAANGPFADAICVPKPFTMGGFPFTLGIFLAQHRFLQIERRGRGTRVGGKKIRRAFDRHAT